MSETRALPDLLSEAERKQLLVDAEELWRRLEANDIGGFSGINRPYMRHGGVGRRNRHSVHAHELRGGQGAAEGSELSN